MHKRISVLLSTIFIFALQLKADYYAPAQNAKTHLWGYINQDGKNATKFKYRLAFNFSYGKAIVLRDKWYYLNKENLKEHVFDDTLQRYFSSIVNQKFKLKEHKYFDDSVYSISSSFSPPYNNFNETGYDGEQYYLFHFLTSNKLLVYKNYLSNKKENQDRNRFFIYDLRMNFIYSSDSLHFFTLPRNNRFIGFEGIIGHYAGLKGKFGIFDSTATLIYDLDTIRNAMTMKIKSLSQDETKYWKGLDTNIIFSNLSYWDLSPNCIFIGFGLTYFSPDSWGLDTIFILNTPRNKIFPISQNPFIMDNKKKSEIVKFCQCNNTGFNQRYDSIKKKWYYKFYDSDSIFIDEDFLQSKELITAYNGYYLSEYYKDYKNAPRFYSFMKWQNKEKPEEDRKYLWGVWDGEKIIIKPKYLLLGVFQ